jgi:hypothetical protein
MFQTFNDIPILQTHKPIGSEILLLKKTCGQKWNSQTLPNDTNVQTVQNSVFTQI